MKKIYSMIGAVAITVAATAQTSTRSISNAQVKATPVTNQIVTSVTTSTTTVLIPVSVTTCTSDIHVLSVGSGTSYVGYLAGTNAYGDLQKAQAYNLTTYSLTTPATVSGVEAYIGYKTGTTGSITAKVYADNSGTVGTLLGTSASVSLSSVNTSSLTAFTFTTPVSLTGTKFYVSVDMSGLTTAGDTIAIASTNTCTANGSGAWEQQSSNSWYNFTDATNSWGASATMDLLIFPVVTANVVSGIHNLNKDVEILNVFPNPASSELNLSYSLQKDATVEIEMYSVTGTLVKTVAPQVMEAGTHQTKVDISSLQSGLYMYCIKSNGAKAFGKITVTK